MTITIQIDRIKIYDDQRTPKPSLVTRIAGKIRAEGYNPSYPVTLDKSFGLVDGGHRIEAARRAGLMEVPFITLDIDKDDTAARIRHRILCNECGAMTSSEGDPIIERFDGVPVVYFIEGAGLVKIGTTTRIKNRLMELQVGSPVRLEIVGIIKGGEEDELKIHSLFEKQRSHGEWFFFAKEIKEYVTKEGVRAWKHL